MIRIGILTLFVITTLSTSVSAQDDKIPNLWVGIQANTIPAFQVNSIEHTRTESQGIVLSIYDYEQSPFGINFQLFRGFHSSIDFLYGGGVFYTVINDDLFNLKSGINISRFAVNDYKQEFEFVGGKIEDQFPESLKPYIEMEWPLVKSMRLTIQGGYRLLRSEIGTVTEILERYPNGKPSQVSVSEEDKWYGSGFEFGLGFKLRLL